jgi:hypothetical protein
VEGEVDVAGDLMDGAPPVDISADRDEPAIPLRKRAKPASVPEESFADIDADLADHAPNAPVTPWRGLPSLQAEPVDITPPRGTPIDAINFGGDDARESEPEATMVGKVPDNLMELSLPGADENTRAFTAPRELIELAKRKREERDVANSNAPLAAHARVTARPPGRGGARIDNEDLSVPAAPNVPVESVSPADPESDAAPPVARTVSGEMEAVALPSRNIQRSEPAPSGPEIEIDPGSELSPSAYRAIIGANAKASPVSEPVSALRKPAFNRTWLLLIALFVVGGVIIARWRELAIMFR